MLSLCNHLYHSLLSVIYIIQSHFKASAGAHMDYICNETFIGILYIDAIYSDLQWCCVDLSILVGEFINYEVNPSMPLKIPL